ncbi:MAG TPA: KGG domain-containing protein [Polyangiaceae bacterium]|nr:KGG domain-containing protein [Polyangiaceae bacterium]
MTDKTDTIVPPAADTVPAPRPRGFAAMDPARVRELGRKGGKAATNRNRWTTETAREAGRRGGKVTSERRRGLA